MKGTNVLRYSLGIGQDLRSKVGPMASHTETIYPTTSGSAAQPRPAITGFMPILPQEWLCCDNAAQRCNERATRPLLGAHSKNQ